MIICACNLILIFLLKTLKAILFFLLLSISLSYGKRTVSYDYLDLARFAPMTSKNTKVSN